jgi:ferredoxin
MTRLAIDTAKCEGHGRCVAIAPELFDVDDYGMSFLLVDEVPADELEAAKRAIDACPERAISSTED